MKRCAVSALALSVLAVGSAWAGGAGMVELEPAKDNTLYEDPEGALSNGAGSRMFVGVTGQFQNNRRRGLLEFDVAGAVPAGSTITGATLTLTVVNVVSSTPFDVSLFRAQQEWGEGDSVAPGGQGAGGAAQPGDATWTHSEFASVLWTSMGGDFAFSASGAASVGGLGSVQWTGASVIGDVQSWLDDSASNHGWLLLGVEGAGANAKVFATRNDFNTSIRPVLSITYVPAPGAAALGLLVGCHALTRPRRARRAVGRF